MKLTLEKNQKLFFTSDTHYAHTNICRGVTSWKDAEDKTRDFKTLDKMIRKITNILGKLMTIEQLDSLRNELDSIRRIKFNSNYKVINIYPGKRIENIIEKETGLYCYHVPSRSGGRGTHKIIIPIKQYSAKLEAELILKYDDNTL